MQVNSWAFSRFRKSTYFLFLEEQSVLGHLQMEADEVECH